MNKYKIIEQIDSIISNKLIYVQSVNKKANLYIFS